MFFDAIAGTYAATCELVGLCDLSQTRMDWYNRRLQDEFDYAPVPTYPADQFS